MKHKRARYQAGSLTTEKRKTGPFVWVYRWRELEDQKTVNRKRIVGTKAEYPHKRDAQRAVDALRLDINTGASVTARRQLTVAELITHYAETEMGPESRLAQSTRALYRQYIARYILPTWGAFRLQEVRPVPVEHWLQGLPHAPGTKAKIRNILSALYQHACRHEWVSVNPIKMVRQSAKRVAQPEILEPQEIQALLFELPEPIQTMTLVAALTGIRVSEILGLQWADVEFASLRINLRRGVVNQNVGALKTQGSRAPMSIPEQLASALGKWKNRTLFCSPEDWVFASPSQNGKRPYWPGTLLQRHIQPAAIRAGITKRVGWHTFRRTLASLLQQDGASIKVTQEIMRHSSPNVTMGVYAQAVTADKRQAQNRIAQMILSNSEHQAAMAWCVPSRT